VGRSLELFDLFVVDQAAVSEKATAEGVAEAVLGAVEREKRDPQTAQEVVIVLEAIQECKAHADLKWSNDISPVTFKKWQGLGDSPSKD
jgi:hypothetical protein